MNACYEELKESVKNQKLISLIERVEEKHVKLARAFINVKVTKTGAWSSHCVYPPINYPAERRNVEYTTM